MDQPAPDNQDGEEVFIPWVDSFCEKAMNSVLSAEDHQFSTCVSAVSAVSTSGSGTENIQQVSPV